MAFPTSNQEQTPNDILETERLKIAKLLEEAARKNPTQAVRPEQVQEIAQEVAVLHPDIQKSDVVEKILTIAKDEGIGFLNLAGEAITEGVFDTLFDAIFN